MIRALFIFAVFVVFPSVCVSAIIHVPGDYTLIQDAIDAAVDGDTILVAPGEYEENLYITTKKIILKSSDGPESTVLKNPNSSPTSVVYFTNTPPETILEGFTITNGTDSGIMSTDSSCVIRGNIISANDSTSSLWKGGGMHSEGGAPTLIDNLFYQNISLRGGGVHLREGSATVINTIFQENVCYEANGGLGGGMCAYAMDLMVANCIFIDNTVKVDYVDPPFPKYPSGGGIMWKACTGYVTNCIFVGNHAASGLYTYPRGCGAWFTEGNPVMSNCIVWNNTGSDSVEGNTSYSVNHSVLQETHPGSGNIVEDPHLIIEGVSFTLEAFSPCIDAGDNNAPGIQDTDFSGMPRKIDGDGNNSSITDMGANEFLMFSADAYTLSAATGGAINLSLDAGPDDAHRKYLILGCVSGISPGTPLPGGYVTLPLNWDGITDMIWSWINTPPLTHFMGFLDVRGIASAQLNLGSLPPSTVGTKVYFAYLCNNPFNLASHPIEVLVVP